MRSCFDATRFVDSKIRKNIYISKTGGSEQGFKAIPQYRGDIWMDEYMDGVR